MNWTNPIYYVSIPFAYLLGIIKESNTKRNRIFMIIMGSLLLAGGLFLLVKWHEIPSYTHYINVERIYTSDSVKDDIFCGYYNLYLGHQKESKSNYTESYFIQKNKSDSNKVGISYKDMYYKMGFNYEYEDIRDLLSGEDGKVLEKTLSENNQKLSDYNYGFRTIHAFQNDMNPLKDGITVFITDKRQYSDLYLEENTVGLSYTTDQPDSICSFFTPLDLYSLYNQKFNNAYVNLLFGKNRPVSIKSLENRHNTIASKIKRFISLNDISKAKYDFYLLNRGLDSMVYTIHYGEVVSFSQTNVKPINCTMNSISFNTDLLNNYENMKEMKYYGVNYMVEFVESGNIQTIRILILSALLALPIGMVVKNAWSLLTSPQQSPMINRRKKRGGRKKKQ